MLPAQVVQLTQLFSVVTFPAWSLQYAADVLIVNQPWAIIALFQATDSLLLHVALCHFCLPLYMYHVTSRTILHRHCSKRLSLQLVN